MWSVIITQLGFLVPFRRLYTVEADFDPVAAAFSVWCNQLSQQNPSEPIQPPKRATKSPKWASKTPREYYRYLFYSVIAPLCITHYTMPCHALHCHGSINIVTWKVNLGRFPLKTVSLRQTIPLGLLYLLTCLYFSVTKFDKAVW
jgi:hypothetical protein